MEDTYAVLDALENMTCPGSLEFKPAAYDCVCGKMTARVVGEFWHIPAPTKVVCAR
jgi:hypothetical protein